MAKESKDDAVIVIDNAGLVVNWSPAVERIHGWTASVIVGKHFSMFHVPGTSEPNHRHTELDLAARNGRLALESERVRKDPNTHGAVRPMTNFISRRLLISGLPLLIAGCATQNGEPAAVAPLATANSDPFRYGPVMGEPFAIAALDLDKIDPELLRREVAYPGPYPIGTVVIDIDQRRLFLVQANGSALRYGIGVGREEALNFQGAAILARKSEWPVWTPTKGMIATTPRYAAYAGGMPGGPENPLGARALYIYRDGVDTHFRVHGTNAPKSIGWMVSSGCIRMLNHDIIDLYDRVPVGASIVAVAS